MKQLGLVVLFIFSVLTIDAQSAASDTTKPVKDKRDYFKNRGHFGFYFSLGESFVPGGFILPTTLDEYEFNSVGYGYSYSERVFVSAPTRQTGYSLGLEYVSKTRSRWFFTVDLGLSGYSYGGTYIDKHFYQSYYNTVPTYDTASYSFIYTLVDLRASCFYSILKSNKRRLSIGVGGSLSYVASDVSSDYQPDLTTTADDLIPYTVPFLMARLRYENAITNSNTLFCLEAYFTEGLSLNTNQIALAGVQIGLWF